MDNTFFLIGKDTEDDTDIQSLKIVILYSKDLCVKVIMR